MSNLPDVASDTGFQGHSNPQFNPSAEDSCDPPPRYEEHEQYPTPSGGVPAPPGNMPDLTPEDPPSYSDVTNRTTPTAPQINNSTRDARV